MFVKKIGERVDILKQVCYNGRVDLSNIGLRHKDN